HRPATPARRRRLLPPYRHVGLPGVLAQARGQVMKISECDILVLPGLGNSGPGHWQLRWAERMASAAIVEQADWHEPDLDDWVDTIDQACRLTTRPVVLVAHSLATIAVAQAAPKLPDNVRGAFLVSVPDIELSPEAPEETFGFRP